MGSGLVGGVIQGLKFKNPQLLEWIQETGQRAGDFTETQWKKKFEKALIERAMANAPQFKSKKALAQYVKEYKYNDAGLPLPQKRVPRPRTAKQQEATRKMRDAWAQARDVANAWDAKVNENPT
jgi:hypothetical protein